MKVYGGDMVAALKIKDVADATGLTTATLRYYEQIGLLPAAVRTPAGYRTYDERTIDRLAFIVRAKKLGCTLDEIAELTVAWDGGQCGPIQDQLRALVAGKLAAAGVQIAELMTFTADLKNAAAALERHRPEGACDADCGCVTDPGDAAVDATVRSISLVAKPEVPLACTLAPASMHRRSEEWQRLLTHVHRRTRINGGVRCELTAGAPTGELMRLVSSEQDCCQFFEFAITVDTRGVALEVRAPADALSIITALFGSPS